MSQVFVTKLLLETQSPMAINTGSREEGFDAQLARDVNGLPYIPASAIAGVWGHLVVKHFDIGLRDKWFGTTSQASTLVIANAIVHDTDNQPVTALMPDHKIENDPLLRMLALERPHHRERVAINDRGVAKQTGKFDQLLLPKGVRFSVTLKWTTQKRQDEQQLTNKEWEDLLSLWHDHQFAFGSSTRNGLGRIKVVSCEQKSFDLSDGRQTGKALQTLLNKRDIHGKALPELAKTKTELLATLPLQALDNWRCGSGTSLLGENNTEASIALISYSEPQIQWKGNQAKVVPNQPVLCGSSIKGILAHRIAFHLRRYTGEWAEDLAEASHEKWQEAPKQLQQLFGYAADKEQGQAGKLYVEDAEIEFDHTVIRTHNKIDRFTGGVQQGALFSEELLYQPKFTLKIWLEQDTRLDSAMQNALRDTIEDLQLGLLPMGAGSGRGTSLVMPQAHKSWTFNLPLIQAQQAAEEHA